MITGTIPADGHLIVIGLGLGDEAKGATVDWLCADTPAVRSRSPRSSRTPGSASRPR